MTNHIRHALLSTLLCTLVAACGGGDDAPAAEAIAKVDLGCTMPVSQAVIKASCAALLVVDAEETVSVTYAGTIIFDNPAPREATMSRAFSIAINGHETPTQTVAVTVGPAGRVTAPFSINRQIRLADIPGTHFAEVDLNSRDDANQSTVTAVLLTVARSR